MEDEVREKFMKESKELGRQFAEQSMQQMKELKLDITEILDVIDISVRVALLNKNQIKALMFILKGILDDAEYLHKKYKP